MPKGSDIFKSSAGTLVCPVNLIGDMSGGISRLFHVYYTKVCDDWITRCGNLNTDTNEGLILSHERDKDDPIIKANGPMVVNICFLPVHRTPVEPASLSRIVRGLDNLLDQVHNNQIANHIAVPALGCGLGGLDYTTQVGPVMEGLLSRPHVQGTAELYQPG